MTFASYSPGSSLAAIQVTRWRSHASAGQPLLAAFSSACGAKSSPSRARRSVSSRRSPDGAHATLTPQWSRSRSPTGRSATTGSASRSSVACGPIPERRRIAGEKYAPAASTTPRPRGGSPPRRRRRPRGRHAGRPGRRECRAARSGSVAHGTRRGRRAPRSSVLRRRRSPGTSLRRPAGRGRPGRRGAGSRARCAASTKARWKGLGVVRVRGARSAASPALVRGRARGSRTSSRSPTRRSPRTFPAPTMHAFTDDEPPSTFPPSVLPSVGPGSPEVRRRGRACVEDLRRPAALAQRAVVGAGLEQADVPVGVLAQSRREDAPRRSSAHDDDVEAHGPRIRRGRYPHGVSPLDVLSHVDAGAGSSAPSRRRRPRRRSAGRRSRRGGHVLIQAPTGSGKTLAAFLLGHRPAERDARGGAAAALRLAAEGAQLRHRAEPPQPARRARLEAPGRRSERATRPAEERRRMLRTPPDILITTPESLFLLLTSQARETLRGVETVILDEVHAVAGSKRGAHLALSLERLERLVDEPFQRVGLSATQRPLEEIGRFVGGHRARDRARRRGRPQGARPRRSSSPSRTCASSARRPSSPCRRSRTASRWASASSARAARSGRRSTRRSSSWSGRTARRSSSSTTAGSPSGSRCGSTSSPRRSSHARTTARSRASSGSSSRSS